MWVILFGKKCPSYLHWIVPLVEILYMSAEVCIAFGVCSVCLNSCAFCFPMMFPQVFFSLTLSFSCIFGCQPLASSFPPGCICLLWGRGMLRNEQQQANCTGHVNSLPCCIPYCGGQDFYKRLSALGIPLLVHFNGTDWHLVRREFWSLHLMNNWDIQSLWLRWAGSSKREILSFFELPCESWFHKDHSPFMGWACPDGRERGCQVLPVMVCEKPLPSSGKSWNCSK